MACNCNNIPCNCGVQIPYYEDPCFQVNQDQGCKIYNQYSAVIRISTGWAVPEASNIITLKVAALADIMIGAIISNPTYGDYEIVSYDQAGQLIKVVKTFYNEVAVGTVIPSCTKFLVTSNDYAALIEYLESFIPTLNFQEVEAAGTTQEDAALVTGTTVNVTGSNGTNGVVLKNYVPGNIIYLYNDSSSSLIIYPPSGGEINGEGVDQAVSTVGETLVIIACFPNSKYKVIV